MIVLLVVPSAMTALSLPGVVVGAAAMLLYLWWRVR